jgi:polyhydroxyalkanoate synthesis repressor PhaR
MTRRVSFEGMREARGARVVRRYGNRKLYDTQARRYVTLDGLSRLVASGHDVEVVDQATGEDLTAVVLAQVILEGVRERTARVPRQVLAAIVRLGADTATAAAEWPPAQAAVRAGHEAERIARKVMDRLTLEEAAALRQEIAEALHRGVVEAQHGLQARFAGLLRRLEKEAAGHPALATVGSWVAAWAGQEARRRTSWQESTGRQPQPAGRRTRRGRRASPRPPRERAPSRSSGKAGSPRSRPSPGRRRRSAGRSRRS